MATFQSIVLIVAIIILLIILVIVGVALHYKKYVSKWPPKVGMCPDYWVAYPGSAEEARKITNANDIHFNPDDIYSKSSDSKGAVCVNVKRLGGRSVNVAAPHFYVQDFTGPGFKLADPQQSSCARYKWATDPNVNTSWDGITYGTSTGPCSIIPGSSSPGGPGGQCLLSTIPFNSAVNKVNSTVSSYNQGYI